MILSSRTFRYLENVAKIIMLVYLAAAVYEIVSPNKPLTPFQHWVGIIQMASLGLFSYFFVHLFRRSEELDTNRRNVKVSAIVVSKKLRNLLTQLLKSEQEHVCLAYGFKDGEVIALLDDIPIASAPETDVMHGATSIEFELHSLQTARTFVKNLFRKRRWMFEHRVGILVHLHPAIRRKMLPVSSQEDYDVLFDMLIGGTDRSFVDYALANLRIPLSDEDVKVIRAHSDYKIGILLYGVPREVDEHFEVRLNYDAVAYELTDGSRVIPLRVLEEYPSAFGRRCALLLRAAEKAKKRWLK